MDCSRRWSSPKRKINTPSPRERKDKCTNPTKPPSLILDLTAVFNLILPFLLSLPYLLSSTCILQPDFSPSNVFPSPGLSGMPGNQLGAGAEGIWHCCIPSSAL